MTLPPDLDLSEIADLARVTPGAAFTMFFGDRTTLRADEIARMMAVIERIDPALDLPPQPNSQGAILVVVPTRRRGPTDDFNGIVSQGLVALAKEHGYSLAFYYQGADVISDVRPLFKAFDMAIMIATFNTLALVRACESLGLPHILIETDSVTGHARGVNINTDGRHALQTGMAHLIELGHRRIGFITGLTGHIATEARLAGYRDGLAQAGIAPDETLIVPGTWLEPSGYEGAQHLLHLPEPPTAIVAANDLMALGVYRAAQEAGLRIGWELSVIGFDDLEAVALVAPPLTTLRQPYEQMARLAFEHVQCFTAKQPLSQHGYLLPAELVIRRSTGPALHR